MVYIQQRHLQQVSGHDIVYEYHMYSSVARLSQF